MTKPLISVIIPAWNEEKYIRPCLESLKQQTYSNFEVIFVDNHSTDSTPQLVKSAGWQIFNQKKSGISAARAEGFAKARGEIIASTNADTVVPDYWLSTIADAFTHPQVVCTYGPVYFKEGRHHPFYFFMNIASWIFFSFTHLIGRDHTIGENFAVRKSAYQAIGGYNEKLPTAEDVDLGYRMKKTGDFIYNPRLRVFTSNRRLAHQKLHFFIHHIENYIRLTFFGNASSDFKPIR